MYDINGDGKVDLSATYQAGGGQWWINNSTPGHVNFTPTNITRDTNTAREQVMFDFNGDGNVDWFRSAPPGLVVDFGDGHGGFTEGSRTFPIPGTDSNNNANFLPGDFNGDGKIDLLVMTGGGYDGTVGKTAYWRNNGDGTFTDVTASVGLPANGFVAKGVGDFDQDGDIDVIGIQNKSMPPVTYLNDGFGHFAIKPNAISGVAAGSLDYAAWGTAVTTDFDNDGTADIIMDGKYYLMVLRGTGGGNFTYMNTTWGIKDTAAASLDDGLSFGDIDGDGRLDVVGYNETWPSRTLNVYHNDLATQNWLNVRPVGLAGNVGAAVAKISIYAAGTNQLLWFEQVGAYDFQSAPSYCAYGETERHYGLGTRANVDVIVQFASGLVTRVSNVAANQTIRVLENGDGMHAPVAVPLAGGVGGSSDTTAESSNLGLRRTALMAKPGAAVAGTDWGQPAWAGYLPVEQSGGVSSRQTGNSSETGPDAGGSVLFLHAAARIDGESAGAARPGGIEHTGVPIDDPDRGSEIDHDAPGMSATAEPGSRLVPAAGRSGSQNGGRSST
jgi:hypothetical protein